MPEAKAIKWCLLAASIWIGSGAAQAQPVLGEMIDQTKQQKQRQLLPPAKEASNDAANAAVTPPPPPPPPELWSITGVNGQLIAEIWQGESVHRLMLEKGAKLPTGWRVVDFDTQSVTIKKGKAQRTLTAASRGSTGWEFPQTPKTAPIAATGSSPSTPGTNNPMARSAASSLPPAAMPGAPATSSMPSSSSGPR